MSVALAWVNILEHSTLSVTSEEPQYPKERLFDRRLGRMWAASSSASQTILVDQGDNIAAADALAIPAGHNLAGGSLSWQYSTDGSQWYDAVNSWTAQSGFIYKRAVSPLNKRFWRLLISGAQAPPRMGELFLTRIREFQTAAPAHLSTPWRYTAQRLESVSGVVGWLKLGTRRRAYEFTLPYLTAEDYALVVEWLTAWDGCKPFLWVDWSGDAMFCEIERSPAVAHLPGDYRTLQVSLLEVI